MLNSFMTPLVSFSEVFPQSMQIVLAVLFVGVLISDLLGNSIFFNNRFLNALTTAVIATALTFGVSTALDAISEEFGQERIEIFLFVFVGVFISDLIGNMVTFSNRFTNALTTAIVSVILVSVLLIVARQYGLS